MSCQGYEGLREDIEKLQEIRSKLKGIEERKELDVSILSLVKEYEQKTGQPYQAGESSE